MGAVKAVFRSWNNHRAIVYRRMNDIPSDWGTAVNVQAMVFGNMGDTSGTGVAFTRNPCHRRQPAATASILMNAQGEDVVAGMRTPESIDQLKQVMPEVYDQFCGIADNAGKALPRHAGYGVYHRTRQAVHAADQKRQAHGAGRAEDRRGPGGRRHDHQGRSAL